MRIVIDIPEYIYEKCIRQNHYTANLARLIKSGTVLPEHPTNGDIMKAMFPNREVVEHDTWIELSWVDGMDEFDKNWWNAPYKRGNRDADSN